MGFSLFLFRDIALFYGPQFGVKSTTCLFSETERKDIISGAKCRLNKKKSPPLRSPPVEDGFLEFARETDFSTGKRIHSPETDLHEIRRRCHINFPTHVHFIVYITRVYLTDSSVIFMNVYLLVKKFF